MLRAGQPRRAELDRDRAAQPDSAGPAGTLVERNDRFVSAALVVVPAKVEIFCGIRVGHGGWTPAFAGVTP